MYNIKIKTSEIMTKYLGFYINENRMLRIPKVLREQLNFEVGQQILMKTISDESIILHIGNCYLSDLEDDETFCYVTKHIFEKINIDINTNKFNIECIDNITLGCDPEFFLIDKQNRKMLKAHMFFKKWGQVGCDNILAELRPKPSLTTIGLTNNIYSLICSARNILNYNNIYDPNRITMLAASSYNNSSAGFHLHFGLPKDILGKKPNKMNIMCQVVRVMDYYISIPTTVIEGDTDTNRRSNIFLSYGKPGDFRLDNKTLEYRVPGGSLLKHPILTKGLIALGAVVTEDIISKLSYYTEKFKNLYWDNFKDIYPNVLDTQTVYNIICSKNTYIARKYLDPIYSDIQKMIGFNKRRKDIEEFFYHIEKSIQYNSNIESNWGEFYEQDIKFCGKSDKNDFNCL